MADRLKFSGWTSKHLAFGARPLMIPSRRRLITAMGWWAILWGCAGDHSAVSAREVADGCCCRPEAASSSDSIVCTCCCSAPVSESPTSRLEDVPCGCRMTPTPSAPAPSDPSPSRDRPERRPSQERWLSDSAVEDVRLCSAIAASRFGHRGPPRFLFDFPPLYLRVSRLLI